MASLDHKYNVYLGGPIFGRTDSDCKDWRNKATEVLSEVANTIDPMRRDYRGRTDMPGIDVEIVELDKHDIDESDVLLVYYDKPSVGTSMEILYAYNHMKYIVVVNASGQKVVSPWLTYHASVMFDNLDDALEHLKEVDVLSLDTSLIEEVGIWPEDEKV